MRRRGLTPKTAARQARQLKHQREELVKAVLFQDVDTEVDKLKQAYELAKVAYEGDKKMLSRLGKAYLIALTEPIAPLGGGEYEVHGYRVNGQCTCEDWHWNSGYHDGWCKHRLAVALLVKAEKIEAGSADDTPAPEAPKEDPTQEQDTTERVRVQVTTRDPWDKSDGSADSWYRRNAAPRSLGWSYS